MATGQVLFHRFFYSKSFVKHSFEVRAAGPGGVGERGGLGAALSQPRSEQAALSEPPGHGLLGFFCSCVILIL